MATAPTVHDFKMSATNKNGPGSPESPGRFSFRTI